MDSNSSSGGPRARDLVMNHIHICLRFIELLVQMFRVLASRRRRVERTYELGYDKHRQIIHNLVYKSDETCYKMLRMRRKPFEKLRDMLFEHGKLRDKRCVLVDEQLAITLHILGHNIRNRVISTWFQRSGETVSKVFRRTIRALIRLHRMLLKHPVPIGPNENDLRWSYFQGCLGAIDGTHIPIIVRKNQKAQFRCRKGFPTMNVMCACTPSKLITYILPGWEGSAADGRILRDALSRRNGLKVPSDNYYLVDAGYSNCQGFLAPFRGQRYHLSEWASGNHPAQTPEEVFNMRHAKARNIIETCFGALKQRWAVLRSPCFYDVKMTTLIIIACAVLHNFLTMEEPDDLLDTVVVEGQELGAEDDASNEPPEVISQVGQTDAWTAFRNNLAMDMWDSYH
ncbi:hypothetical protein Scep_014249 [Stephania cephalantha]|uniref:DDE Tnp4 domain-containing protein n=1 Tax=Stephania cephalantha TaxID=152367 RepID=A0AAP0J2R3_9MAGN